MSTSEADLITKLIKYKEELQRSNYELENFASIASHDLKEPLKKIIAYAERLEESTRGQISSKDEKSILKINESAAHLLELIDGLLEFARVSTRAKPFESINLNLIIKAVLSDLEEQISEAGAYINTQELPTVHADKIQMHQLFQNLIANAIKFRQEESVPVINIRKKLLDGGIWQISIEDNGIGFENKHTDKIFKQFYRVNQQSGSGIGLSVCERIIKRHGGEISASSQKDKGSIFTFTLPSYVEDDSQEQDKVIE